MKNFHLADNLQELTKHRTSELPIACYETTITNHINGYIPLHWHEELQFIHVLKGEAVFQIQEEQTIVRKGEGLFINSGCLHMAIDRNHSDCMYTCINVSPNFMVAPELYSHFMYPYIRATNFRYVHLNPQKTWAKQILTSIEKISQWMKAQSLFYEMDLAMELTLVWKNLLANGAELEYEATEMAKNQRMKDMLHWIQTHYADKIHLEDIARAGNLSRSECCRYFIRVLQQTPMAYVTDYRIQKSLQLLQDPDSNVTDVAYRVGFNSTSYFIDQFRKKMGITPLAFKKKSGF